MKTASRKALDLGLKFPLLILPVPVEFSPSATVKTVSRKPLDLGLKFPLLILEPQPLTP